MFKHLDEIIEMAGRKITPFNRVLCVWAVIKTSIKHPVITLKVILYR